MGELEPPSIPDRPFFKWIQQNRLFDRFRALLRTVRPWKDKSMNVYDVSRFFFLGLVNGSVATRSAAISFKLFVAFFPAMILLLSIIPFTPLETEEVLLSLEQFFPKQAIELFEQTVKDLIDQRQGTLLSVGVVLLLFYASNSVNAILVGFGESAHVGGQPMNWLGFRLLSIALLLILSVLLVVAVFLIGFAGDVLSWAASRGWLEQVNVPLLTLARWALSFGLIYTAVTILYNVGNFMTRRWVWWSIGATGTTALFILITFTFSWFIDQFASYNSLYGSLGTLLITLLWLNSNSSILLLGYELNAAVERARLDAEKTP
jgi:membrane protein